MDYNILKLIHKMFSNSKIIANIAKIFSIFGDFWTYIAIFILLLCFKKSRKIGFYALITVVFTVCFNNLAIKLIVKRNRPFVDYPEFASICNFVNYGLPRDYSMPSSHSAVSMAFAVSILFFSKKYGLIAVLFSILVGLSRVCLCVHYPSDVIVGWIVGVVFAITLHYLLNLILNNINLRRNKYDKNSFSNKKSK